MFLHGFLPEFENLPQLTLNKKMRDIAEGFQRQSVAHLVLDQRFIRFELGERVTMDPLLIWTGELLIDELIRRIPFRDKRSP